MEKQDPSNSNTCRVGLAQLRCGENVQANLANAEKLIAKAGEMGVDIFLLPELFASQYFCQSQDERYYDLAVEFGEPAFFERFVALAKHYRMVLPISYFERASQAYFNSLVVIDADGRLLGNYRKSHIPNGPGYQEKHFFSPGDTGFRVWQTQHGNIGIGICWDQWFPEAARIMALKGAELLFYPTAIGSEPLDPDYDSSRHWCRTMQGHSAANLMPVIAANRVGRECIIDDQGIRFYGSSFITDQTGDLLQSADQSEETILVQDFNLPEMAQSRREWGVFRDRRPELYREICSFDGVQLFPPT